jgi:hypothetical protein
MPRYSTHLAPVLSLVALALFTLAGCSQPVSNPGGVSVSGVVTFEGKPLTKGTITFVPETPGTGGTATGSLSSSGAYSLGTAQAGDGAIPARYKVTVVSLDSEATMDEKGKPVPAKSAIPAKFGNAATSGLTATVEKSGSQTFNFDLK